LSLDGPCRNPNFAGATSLRLHAAVCVVLGLGVLAGTPAALAEPYLAVIYGYNCSQCHLNPTGAGKRNEFGNIFSQTEMPARTVSAADINRFLGLGKTALKGEDAGSGPAEFTLDSTFYSGYLASFLSVGGDFRINNRTLFREAIESTTNAFDLSQGSLYASLEFFDGALVLYLDETVAPGGATSREAFALLRGPWNSYLKAGRMFLPFGLRLQDDTAFVRELSGFSRGVQDVGAEIGIEPGPLSLSLAVSNGSGGSSDDNRDKQLTAMASFIQRHWRVGTQATWNNAAAVQRLGVGGFAGVQLGPFSVLGEVDHFIDELEEAPGEPTQRRILVYGAVHCQVTKGLSLQVAYDFADPDLSEPDDTFVRVSGGVEYTVMQFVQIRLFYRFRDDVEDSLRDDEGVLDFEVHVFF
jgi:hypothetical protein